MRNRPPARSRVVPALVTVVTAVAVLLGTTAVAAPAHAGRRTILDPRHDVLKQVAQNPPKVARSNESADVTRFVTTLGDTRLTLSTTVRDLPKNFWAMLWAVQTDAGTTYSVDLLKTGDVKFELSQADVPVACEGMEKKVEKRRSRITVAIPLTCLGDPASVRAGAGAAATSRDFGRIFTDDANRKGRYTTGDLKLGRTVKRG